MARSSQNRLSTSGVGRIVLSILVFYFLFFHIMGRQSNHGHHKKKKKNTSGVGRIVSSSCRRCTCDCLPEIDSVTLPVDFLNSSYSDCAKNHPEMNEEMKKDTLTLLSEEINLHKIVTRTNLDSIQQSIIDVKQTISKYQKEAEKCNTGVQICEEGRERAEAALIKEIKLSALWEQCAREFGWKDESA